MSKQTLVVIIGAIVLVAVGIVGALAFTGGGSSDGHQMQNGQTMTGDMTHTMQDGETMTTQMTDTAP